MSNANGLSLVRKRKTETLKTNDKKRVWKMVSVAVKTTIERIVEWLRGVENKRIDDWLENDEESYVKMNEFLNNCAAAGWTETKDSPFDFADKKTIQLSEELYIAATKHFGGVKD